MNLHFIIERFPIKCLKTKTKVITLSSTKNVDSPLNQSKADTSSWREARENEGEWGTIGFSLTSDWMKKWREFF